MPFLELGGDLIGSFFHLTLTFIIIPLNDLQLQRVQRDMKNIKREQESLVQQNEDKENTIFQLKKDLRSMKEQLNEEKIRHRRSKVMQSRIPVPTKGSSTRNLVQSQKTSGLMKPSLSRQVKPSPSGLVKPSLRINDGTGRKRDPKLTDTFERKMTDPKNVSEIGDREKYDPNNVARIRYRVLKILQEHDPAKVDKLDAVMNKFEGRETELLEKMMARYHESVNEDSKFVTSTAETRESNSATLSSKDSRPKSRQDKALERHMARMKRIKALAEN